MVSRAALCQFCLAMAVGYWLAGPLLLRLRWLSPPSTAVSPLPSELPAVPRALLKPDGAQPLQPAVTTGPFDLDRRRGLRAAVAARAHGGELVLFTSNAFGIPNAVNMALQLRRLSIEHHLVLADARETCSTAQRTWAWLGCGWSHGMRGFTERYGESKQGGTDDTAEILARITDSLVGQRMRVRPMLLVGFGSTYSRNMR